MAKLPIRVKVLGRVMGQFIAIEKMSTEQIERTHHRAIPRNRIVDWLQGPLAAGVAMRDLASVGADGPVQIRVYRAADGPKRRPLVFNIHGGGWAFGSLDQSDWLCGRVARETGAVVVSVDYRLAPTHPWPAAAEDCYAAFVDVVGRAEELGFDPTRIGVMGDSAGGNLAAVLTLMVRDRGGPAITHQALLYPVTDLSETRPSTEENAFAPILTKANMEAFREHYLGAQDPTDPYISPMHAIDHTGLPPALVQVAEHDPLRDDGLDYAAKLEVAGSRVRVTTYVGMPHGFYAFPGVCVGAEQAVSELIAEHRRALAPAPESG